MAEKATRGRYGRFLRELVNIVDLLTVNALFGLLCYVHPEVVETFGRVKWLLVSVAYMPVAAMFDRSRLQRSVHIDRLLFMAIQAVVVHALFFMSLLAFTHAGAIEPRYFLQFYLAMLVVFPTEWVITRLAIKYVRVKGRNYTNVVIIGTNQTAVRLGRRLLDDEGYGYRVLGFFDKSPAPGFAGIYCGTIDMLKDYIEENLVDEVYYALSGEYEESLLRVIRICDDTMVKFHYVPKISPYVGRRFELVSMGGIPVLTPQINPLSRRWNQAVKRVFDLFFSSCFLIVSPIVFIPIAIAVKLSSPGPVFFRQVRTGYRGRDFVCLKFRTMRVNADSDRVQATDSDPRKTRVGDFLRRTSLDELPQFINVFKGDMSVCGPRPHMLAHTEQYRRLIDRYMIRHMVKPGVTGWAQVCGLRGNTDELWKMEKRVQADVWYIEHWSFVLDLKIIVKTIFNGMRGDKNAY